MNRKFLIILSAMFVSAVLAFASLQAQFGNTRTDSQQHIEPVHAAHREQNTVPPQAHIERATLITKNTPETAELTTRIKELQQELDHLKRSAHAGAGDDAHASVSMPLPESEEQERQRTRQITAFLQDNFVAETKDPVWSLQAERQLAEAFNLDKVEAGSELQQLSCQATLCRIEARHKDSTAERDFLLQLGSLESFADAEAFSERIERADGSIEVITYVTRSGHRLPRLDVPEAGA
jgi:hypothetical protein